MSFEITLFLVEMVIKNKVKTEQYFTMAFSNPVSHQNV